MSAPSFPSFTPSFSSFPDLEAGSSSRQDKGCSSDALRSKAKKDKQDRARKDKDGREKYDKRRSKHEHKASKLRIEDDLEHSSSSKYRSSSMKHDFSKETFLEDVKLSAGSSKLFFSDHKGDSLNVVFGSLHAGSVPKYSLIRRGRNVLGLRTSYIARRDGNGITLEDRSEGPSKVPQLSDRRTRKVLETSQARRLRPERKTAFYEESEDGFIRISAEEGRRTGRNNGSYRSIAEETEESGSDASDDENGRSEYESDPDTTPLSAREEALRQLEQEIKKDPSQTSSWISLLEHSLSVIPSFGKESGTARAEITTSILSRALNAHPDNVRSPLLRIKFLKAGEDIWDNLRMKSEWETALRVTKHPDVWMEWLDWRFRRCPDGLDGCVDDVLRVRENGSLGLRDQDKELLYLRIFWRTAVFFRQTGYLERAQAMFQAQAELSFKLPENLNHAPLSHVLLSLEEFWESEVPRLGEASAMGWSAWNPDDRTQLPAVLSEQVNSTALENQTVTSDPYVRWATGEQTCESFHLPLRSTEDDNGDPYRTVLFADIKPFLYEIGSRTGKSLFRMMWLHYAGLRVPGLVNSFSSMPLDERWAEEAFASTSSISSLIKTTDSNAQLSYAGTVIGRQRHYQNAFRIIKQWGLDVRDPFESVGLDGIGRQWEEFVGDEELVRSIFKQLQMDDDAWWSRTWLAFEAAINLKGSTKVSKSLLAKDQSSQILWSAHAHLARLRGRFDEARKVYQTMLVSISQRSEDLAMICWDFAEMEWLLGRSESARDVINLAAGQQDSQGDIQILRSKKAFEENTEKSRNMENWKIRAVWIKLRALLELLTGSLKTALDFLDEKMSLETSRGPCHEHLALSSLSLIYRHTAILKNPAPRILLRDWVSQLIPVYPFNTAVLAFFLESEKGEGVWGRVRELLSEKSLTLLGSKSLSRRIAEIWISGWEEDRWKGEIERVKANLETALTSDETRGSSIIWRILLEVEIKHGSLKRAKTTLFRALGDCPMVKELYLLAFGPLRSEFSSRELNHLADTMAEKGIRLRSSLEYASDNAGVIDTGEEGYENDGMNELEYNSRELRRLMPY